MCVFLATDIYHFPVSSVAALLQTCEFITLFFNYSVHVVTLFFIPSRWMLNTDFAWSIPWMIINDVSDYINFMVRRYLPHKNSIHSVMKSEATEFYRTLHKFSIPSTFCRLHVKNILEIMSDVLQNLTKRLLIFCDHP